MAHAPVRAALPFKYVYCRCAPALAVNAHSADSTRNDRSHLADVPGLVCFPTAIPHYSPDHAKHSFSLRQRSYSSFSASSNDKQRHAVPGLNLLTRFVSACTATPIPQKPYTKGGKCRVHRSPVVVDIPSTEALSPALSLERAEQKGWLQPAFADPDGHRKDLKFAVRFVVSDRF
ncbi:hypothetical protein FKP32DRAFT_959142 [Trametes sanguinea]|nr:hypothetical protein FKP32DRAFT_959142 [Trametes sanguinea]